MRQLQPCRSVLNYEGSDPVSTPRDSKLATLSKGSLKAESAPKGSAPALLFGCVTSAPFCCQPVASRFVSWVVFRVVETGRSVGSAGPESG
jgi:hypothetical protein